MNNSSYPYARQAVVPYDALSSVNWLCQKCGVRFGALPDAQGLVRCACGNSNTAYNQQTLQSTNAMDNINAKRIVSGIRPTGQLHLGNYFGAIKQFAEVQTQASECFFFVADLHALTTALEDKIDLDAVSVDVVRWYLACGVDANKAMIYRQSDIAEISYINVLLSMIAPVGEIERCVTYKDKVSDLESKRKLVSLGLLAYPVLMSADILFANADLVPVGKDQEQHLEITREVARRYNHYFGNNITFVEPKNYALTPMKVPGLQAGKMSKSVGGEDNVIYLADDAKRITKKIKAAKTDMGPVAGEPMSEEMENIYQLLKLCCSQQVYDEYKQMHKAGEQKFYGALKGALAQGVNELVAPIADRYHTSPECSVEYVKQLLHENAARVRPIAERTLRAMQADMGLLQASLRL